jgi:hypothetical protein
MRCIITYQDTCFSDYVPDHRWIGVFVNNQTTVSDVLDALMLEWASDGYHDGAEVTDDMVQAFEDAINAIRTDYGRIGGKLESFWDEDLPSSDDSDETPCAWFTVEFTE